MTETTQQAPVPGWYQDPQGQGLRWWDGTGWTTHVQQSAPPATPAEPASQPAPAAAPQAQVQQAPAQVEPQAQPASAQAPPAQSPPVSPSSTSGGGVKVTGSEKKKSGGSLSDKLNDNPLPVLLGLAAVLVVVVVLFVL